MAWEEWEGRRGWREKTKDSMGGGRGERATWEECPGHAPKVAADWEWGRGKGEVLTMVHPPKLATQCHRTGCSTQRPGLSTLVAS